MDVEIAADGVARRSVETIIGFAVVWVSGGHLIPWVAVEEVADVPKSARGAADRDRAYMMADFKRRREKRCCR